MRSGPSVPEGMVTGLSVVRPEGSLCNSRDRKVVVKDSQQSNEARRAGTLTPQVPLVIFDFISIQKFQEFVFEGSLRVMMTLIIYVFNHSLFFRFADAECAITFLPREASSLWKGLVSPPGRVRFHNADEISNRNR